MWLVFRNLSIDLNKKKGFGDRSLGRRKVMQCVAQTVFTSPFFEVSHHCDIFAGSLEAAYSLNWGAQEIWGKGGGETLALL